eukprot:2039269-Amphidinium_carterae.5
MAKRADELQVDTRGNFNCSHAHVEQDSPVTLVSACKSVSQQARRYVSPAPCDLTHDDGCCNLLVGPVLKETSAISNADLQGVGGKPVLGQDATSGSEHETHLALLWGEILLNEQSAAINFVLRTTEAIMEHTSSSLISKPEGDELCKEASCDHLLCSGARISTQYLTISLWGSGVGNTLRCNGSGRGRGCMAGHGGGDEGKDKLDRMVEHGGGR